MFIVSYTKELIKIHSIGNLRWRRIPALEVCVYPNPYNIELHAALNQTNKAKIGVFQSYEWLKMISKLNIINYWFKYDRTNDPFKNLT